MAKDKVKVLKDEVKELRDCVKEKDRRISKIEERHNTVVFGIVLILICISFILPVMALATIHNELPDTWERDDYNGSKLPRGPTNPALFWSFVGVCILVIIALIAIWSFVLIVKFDL